MRNSTEETIRAAVAAERRELAAVLDGLRDEQWDAPSLCAGWRVREVAAHMTMPFRYSAGRLARELVAAGGGIHRMTDRLARRDAVALSPAELAGTLAEHAGHPWKPPFSGYDRALGHDLVHGLDITVALGLDRRVPEDRLRVVLDGVTPRSARYFGADVRGVELRAEDLDWSFGAGTPVTGAAQDLLLALFGRKLPAGRLRGAAHQRFTAG